MNDDEAHEEQHTQAVVAVQIPPAVSDPVNEVHYQMERLEDDRVGRLDVHAEARQDHDDEQVDAGHHAELGQRIVPDVLAWGPVEKQVPAEVRQQIQPPAFPPERNDEDLSGVLVAEEREDDAPKQADGDDEPRNEVGHAGIAHIKEIGRIAV